jgi:hypothetical protein
VARPEYLISDQVGSANVISKRQITESCPACAFAARYQTKVRLADIDWTLVKCLCNAWQIDSSRCRGVEVQVFAAIAIGRSQMSIEPEMLRRAGADMATQAVMVMLIMRVAALGPNTDEAAQDMHATALGIIDDMKTPELEAATLDALRQYARQVVSGWFTGIGRIEGPA